MNRFISFVLTLSFVIGPYAPTAAQATSPRICAPGEILHISSNTCLKTEESNRIKAEADDECNVLTDPALKASCVNSRVTELTTRAEDNGEMGKHSDKASKITLLPILLAFTTLYAAISHLATKGPTCPGAYSSYFMIGGSVAIIATEAMTKISFNKELKKSQKELEEIVKGSKSEDSDNKNATDLQVQIFEALIKRENGVIKAAEGKKKGYNIAKLLYLSATIAAGVEIFKYATMTAYPPTTALAAATYICTASSSSKPTSETLMYSYINFLEKTKSSITFDEYVKTGIPHEVSSSVNLVADTSDRINFLNGHFASISLNEYRNISIEVEKPSKQNNVLHLAVAAIKQLMIPEANAALVIFNPATMLAIKNFFIMPVTRLTLAGMMTAVTVTLSGHANKEIKKANKRIEVLNKLKSQVSEAGPAVKCANGTEEGKDGCEQVVPTTVKPGENTFSLAATQANGSANTNGRSSFEAKGCANSKGEADPECGCKKTKSCFSMNSNFKIGDFPAGNLLGNGINDINALTNGEISPAGLDSNAMNRQLAAAGKMRDKVLVDLNKDPKIAAELKKAQDSLNGLQRQMFNTMPANAGAAGNGLALSNDNDLSGLSGNQILEQVKEELKEASAPKVTNEALAGSASSDFNFDLGTADPMDVGAGLTEGEATGNVNINDFELAESEINPSSTTNIFEILSSRYKKSAYMRLLKADKEIAPEAPAQKEIND